MDKLFSMDKKEYVEAIQRRRQLYEAAVELVKELRRMGVVIPVTCPVCGLEGSLNVLRSRGYLYLVVRHSDKSTHSVSKSQLEAVLAGLCVVVNDLLRILRGADEACAGGRSTNYNSLREARP